LRSSLFDFGRHVLQFSQISPSTLKPENSKLLVFAFDQKFPADSRAKEKTARKSLAILISLSKRPTTWVNKQILGPAGQAEFNYAGLIAPTLEDGPRGVGKLENIVDQECQELNL